jgi:DNA-binding response OmpR family regulator
MKILIVEDEPALLEVYATLFKTQKFEVYEANNGKIALEQLNAIKPDIIILDLMMPVMSGFDFLKAANIKQKYPKTKILVLSNLSDSKTLNRIETLGAHKYLLKASVSPRELVNAVSQL